MGQYVYMKLLTDSPETYEKLTPLVVVTKTLQVVSSKTPTKVMYKDDLMNKYI